MSLELAAHKAVHDALLAGSGSALAALIGNRVYDRVPATAPVFPYLTVRIGVRDDANTCSNASQVNATINIFSNAVGAQEAQSIGGLVRAALAPDDPDINLAIDGYQVSVTAFDGAFYRPGPDTLITEGIITFTFLVDPEGVT